MKDMQVRVEKVRADATEWALLSGLARRMSPAKNLSQKRRVPKETVTIGPHCSANQST
jgi:hypothetical protein